MQCKNEASLLVPSPLQRHLRQLRLAVHENAQVDVDQLLENLPEVKRQVVKNNEEQRICIDCVHMARDSATNQQEGSQFLSVSGDWVDHGNDVEVRVSLLRTDLYSTDNRNLEEPLLFIQDISAA